MCPLSVDYPGRTHSGHMIGFCLISLGSVQRGSRSKNNLRHITYGKGHVWGGGGGFPLVPLYFFLMQDNIGQRFFIPGVSSSLSYQRALYSNMRTHKHVRTFPIHALQHASHLPTNTGNKVSVNFKLGGGGGDGGRDIRSLAKKDFWYLSFSCSKKML